MYIHTHHNTHTAHTCTTNMYYTYKQIHTHTNTSTSSIQSAALQERGSKIDKSLWVPGSGLSALDLNREPTQGWRAESRGRVGLFRSRTGTRIRAAFKEAVSGHLLREARPRRRYGLVKSKCGP